MHSNFAQQLQQLPCHAIIGVRMQMHKVNKGAVVLRQLFRPAHIQALIHHRAYVGVVAAVLLPIEPRCRRSVDAGDVDFFQGTSNAFHHIHVVQIMVWPLALIEDEVIQIEGPNVVANELRPFGIVPFESAGDEIYRHWLLLDFDRVIVPVDGSVAELANVDDADVACVVDVIPVLHMSPLPEYLLPISVAIAGFVRLHQR
mmetsp:Transcript_9126/g.24633  ORF Transcript_9126/g.24633 Transcript_9126/m.24633 type:complete len:201 (-) Transcript_9126:344-946(-)